MRSILSAALLIEYSQINVIYTNNSMTYGTLRFNALFTRDIQQSHLNILDLINLNKFCLGSACLTTNHDVAGSIPGTSKF